MDHAERQASAVCQHCGQPAPDIDSAGKQQGAKTSETTDSGASDTSHPLKASGKQPRSQHLLVHGESRLGHLFDGKVEGKQLQQRVLLRQFVSDKIAAAEAQFGVHLFVDLDDWPREHERASDVRQALAALEPALHISVAIQPHKLVGLNIRLYPARYMFFIQGSTTFEYIAETGEIATDFSEGGLSGDGVLHIRGNPEDVRRAFCHLNVDVAAERRVAVMQWANMAKQLQQALCSVLRVRYVVHDNSKFAEPTVKQFAHFAARMLQLPALWAPLAQQPQLAIAVRVYNNDRWSRPLGTPAAALVNPRVLDVRHDCHPVQLLAALVVLHRHIEADAAAAKKFGVSAFEQEEEDARKAEQSARKRQQQQKPLAANAQGSNADSAAAAAATTAAAPSLPT